MPKRFCPMQVVFQRSICCPGAHNTQYCCLYFGGTVSHRTPQSMLKESREKKRQRKRQRIRVEETQKATEGAGATDPAGSSGVGQVLMIRLVLDRFNSRLLMACPTGPAEPAAVAESEYSSASSAQTPAAPPSRKRVHSEGAGASDGGKALSSPVVSIKVRRSFRSKKTTTSPGEYSCGACPVFISDFSS